MCKLSPVLTWMECLTFALSVSRIQLDALPKLLKFSVVDIS